MSFTDEMGKVTTLTLVRGIESRLENLHRCASTMRDWHKRKFCGAERPEHVRLQDAKWGVMNVGDAGWQEPDDYEQRPLAIQAPPEFRIAPRKDIPRGGSIKYSICAPIFLIRGCEMALMRLRMRWPDLYSTVFSNGPYVHSELVAANEDYRHNTFVYGGHLEMLASFAVYGSWHSGRELPVGQLETHGSFTRATARCLCLFTPNESAGLVELRDELYMNHMAPTVRTAMCLGACLGTGNLLEGRSVFGDEEAQDRWVEWMGSDEGALWAVSVMSVTGRWNGPAVRCVSYDLWHRIAYNHCGVNVIGEGSAGCTPNRLPAPTRTNHAIRILADRFIQVMRLKGVKNHV